MVATAVRHHPRHLVAPLQTTLDCVQSSSRLNIMMTIMMMEKNLYETLKDPVFWNISALKNSCLPVILSSVVQVNTLNSQKFNLAINTININDKCSWHLPQSYGRSRPPWQLRQWSARDQSRSTWCWKKLFVWLFIHFWSCVSLTPESRGERLRSAWL